MLNGKALIVVDVQNDFCPGGSLAVGRGDMVVPVLNRYMDLFGGLGLKIFASRDWHPARTRHFKEYGGAWPPHCVQGTKGAEFHPGLKLPEDAVIVTKGDRPDEDSYSAFQGRTPDGKPFWQRLREEGIRHVYVGGLATDYCVKDTMLDALKEGLGATLLLDAVQGVDINEGDSKRAIEEMVEAGAQTAVYDELETNI